MRTHVAIVKEVKYSSLFDNIKYVSSHLNTFFYFFKKANYLPLVFKCNKQYNWILLVEDKTIKRFYVLLYILLNFSNKKYIYFFFLLPYTKHFHINKNIKPCPTTI